MERMQTQTVWKPCLLLVRKLYMQKVTSFADEAMNGWCSLHYSAAYL